MVRRWTTALRRRIFGNQVLRGARKRLRALLRGCRGPMRTSHVRLRVRPSRAVSATRAVLLLLRVQSRRRVPRRVALRVVMLRVRSHVRWPKRQRLSAFDELPSMVLRLLRLPLIACLGACEVAFPIHEGEGVPCGAARCKGSCCVTMGAGDYEFECRDAGDACTGAPFDIACDDSKGCPRDKPFCCFTEQPNRADSQCAASCSAFNRMCRPSGTCPPSMTCQPWFASYYVCR